MLLVGGGGEGVGPSGLGDDCLHPLFESGAGEEDAVLTGETADSDVGAQAVDLPVAAAARVRFAHADHVSDGELLGHTIKPWRQPQPGIR